jgi:hypothetical protein
MNLKKITPQQKKYLMIGGGVLAAYLLYRAFSKGNDTSGSTIDPTGNGGTVNPDFNPTVLAQNLYESMYEMGTDDEDVLPILQLIPTQAQFGQVNTKFGTRKYNPTTGNIYAVWPFDLDKYPLRFWLKNELSNEAYAVAKKKYPTYLTGFRPRKAA